jgi:hypothetical protein
MSRTDEPKSDSPFPDVAVGAKVTMYTMQCLMYTHELFARRGYTVGSQYPGVAVTLVGLFLLPALTLGRPSGLPFPTPGESPLLGLIAPVHWAVMVLIAVARRAPNKRRRPVHSRFIGEPLAGLERDPRRWSEIAVGVLLAGTFHVIGCHALGALHLLGLACSRGHLMLIGLREGREEQRMRDARIEAGYHADRMRHH